MSNQDSFRIFIRVILPILMWSFSLPSPHFHRESLIMKNISTGFGLCAIAAAVALYPVLDRFTVDLSGARPRHPPATLEKRIPINNLCKFTSFICTCEIAVYIDSSRICSDRCI